MNAALKGVVRCVPRVVALAMLVHLSGCNLSSDPEELMVQSQAYRQKGDYRAAIIELKNVLQRNPDNAKARYLLGVTYNEAGDVRSAEKELRKALELRYDEQKVLPALAKAWLAMGEYQKVLDQVPAKGTEVGSARAAILTARALASLGLGRESDARDSLKEALAGDPQFADALLAQARVAIGTGNLEEATAYVERAIASDPSNVQAWLMKGDLARARKDVSGAMAAYQKTLELRPDNIIARINIASLHITSGDLDNARGQIAEIRKVAPGNAMAHYLQALVEMRSQNYAAAKNTISQVLKVAPNHVPSMLLAAAVETALGSHVQAQAHLVRVIEHAPGNLYARKLLVSSLMKSGDVARARSVLEPALRQNASDPALMVLAGELHMRSGEFDKAEEYFEAASKRAPKNARLRAQLGVSRFASGETDRALADLESAVNLDAEGYHADILLVTAHLRRKQYDEALKALGGLEQKQPDNPLTYNLKAAIYIGKRDIPRARQELERALKLQPTYLPAAINLARLDIAGKDPHSARRRLEAVAEKDKNNAHALIALAGFAPQIGATQKEQIDWLTRARDISPQLIQPPLMLSRIYAKTGDWRRALEAAEKARAIAPDNPPVLAAVAEAQLQLGQKEQALTTYARLAELQPNSPAALHQLAKAQVANGRNAAATGTLRKALSLKPDFVEAQVALFGLELVNQHYDAAMKLAKQVQEQRPSAPTGFVLEGDAWRAQRKYAQAAAAYDNAFKIRKNSVVAIRRHEAYVRAGNAQRADAQLAQWLKDAPADAAARLYAANVSLKRRDYKAAISHYEWLREKQPRNVLVLNNLAWAYHAVGDPRARTTAEAAHKLKPDSPGVLDTLGWILVQEGDVARGAELLVQAVKAAPEAHEIRYRLAQAWAKAGNQEKSRAELERLLAKGGEFPHRAEAAAMLERMKN